MLIQVNLGHFTFLLINLNFVTHCDYFTFTLRCPYFFSIVWKANLLHQTSRLSVFSNLYFDWLLAVLNSKHHWCFISCCCALDPINPPILINASRTVSEACIHEAFTYQFVRRRNRRERSAGESQANTLAGGKGKRIVDRWTEIFARQHRGEMDLNKTLCESLIIWVRSCLLVQL